MSGAVNSNHEDFVPPPPGETLGHPKALWMLFMAEFWERFAFYGIRWALVLYIVAQFYSGDQSGQADAKDSAKAGKDEGPVIDAEVVDEKKG